MTRSKQRQRKSTASASDVHPIRTVGRLVELALYVAAGGRCEFDGCNKPLVENPLTLTPGNFGERAHIVAFSRNGPRGADGLRPTDINALPNLMLLCPTCHKEIDDHPGRYTRSVLEKYKAEHEKRVVLVLSSSPNRKTTIVQLRARIGGKAVSIPPPDVFAAAAPYFPEDHHGFIIDLAEYDDRDPHFLDLATRKVDEELRPLHSQRLQGQPARHVSVFACGPIPLLMYLGSRISDKLAVRFFQFHRDRKDWMWKKRGRPVDFSLRLRRRGTDPSHVALLLSISASVRPELFPSAIDDSYSLYELAPNVVDPGLYLLRTYADLQRFRRAYLDTFSRFERDHPRATTIHVFPAVPLPVAVAAGHDVLNKAHPTLEVYDNDKVDGGYVHRLTLNTR